MPQITVNEIDQSVVTRVVSDDRVKVLCPIIASFGPAFDGTHRFATSYSEHMKNARAFQRELTARRKAKAAGK